MPVFNPASPIQVPSGYFSASPISRPSLKKLGPLFKLNAIGERGSGQQETNPYLPSYTLKPDEDQSNRKIASLGFIGKTSLAAVKSITLASEVALQEALIESSKMHEGNARGREGEIGGGGGGGGAV